MPCYSNKPTVRLIAEGNTITPCVTWRDHQCAPKDRTLEWTFFHKGKILEVLPFADLKTLISIGNSSTYEQIVLGNGADDVFTFLTEKGHVFAANDTVQIRVRAKNCNGIQSQYYSNTVTLFQSNPTMVHPDAPCHCDTAWLTSGTEVWQTMTGKCWQTIPSETDPVIA